VLYNRVHSADGPDARLAALTSTLFHMELPVYWTNCHRNPYSDPFNDQVIVAKYTVSLLQRLVDACFQGSGMVKIMYAKRIENASIWNKYTAFKRKLRAQLNDGTHFQHAADLDPNLGETKTFAFLSGESSEASVSISNIEEHLNEHLLWHGTTKAAAEKIAAEDFKIASGNEVKHATRFGQGAYLAEDIEKSLTYAEPDENKRRYVLLCRTLCGDFYYTEAHTEIDAGQKRERNKKHTVLANPEKKGPREFIVPSSDQVYPEFVLQLSVMDWTPPDYIHTRLQKTTMEFVIPNGIQPGQMLKLQSPDGRMVDVMVPPNSMPGQKALVEI